MDAGWLNGITDTIIRCGIEVHRTIGPGLLESAYEECLGYELGQAGLRVRRQVPLPVVYKGVRLNCGYRLDLFVEGAVVVELKTVEQLLPVHEAQLLTYLKLSGATLGLLMNFQSATLRYGLRRLVNHFPDPSAPLRLCGE